MKKDEGRLTFEFKTALNVSQPENAADPFKCADFIAEEDDATWLIEVTEAVRAEPGELTKAVADLYGQLTSGRLMKDMLMKQYGTCAYLAHTRCEPGKMVFFCVIIGLPTPRADAAQRNRIRDEMKRTTDRIGPSFHGTTNRPIIKVETIESWNEAHAAVQIS